MAELKDFEVGNIFKCDNKLGCSCNNCLYCVIKKHKDTTYSIRDIKILKGKVKFTNMSATSLVAQHSTLVGYSKIIKVL